MYAYNATITKQEDGSYFIEFPSFEGCFSDGQTREEAISEGAETY